MEIYLVWFDFLGSGARVARVCETEEAAKRVIKLMVKSQFYAKKTLSIECREVLMLGENA